VAVVLVTGASGFLGRHALTALRSGGHEVHGLSRRPPADDACIWHTADMFDADAIAHLIRSLRPSHLLHLAWVTEHGRYWTSPENLRWVEATLHLARHFEAAGGQTFVGAGTGDEYTWDDAILGGSAIDEESGPRARPRTSMASRKTPPSSCWLPTHAPLGSRSHGAGCSFLTDRIVPPC
jgi:nucleoside-diphosphate-sugar epimerase